MANGVHEKSLEEITLTWLKLFHEGKVSRQLVDDWYMYDYDPTSELAAEIEIANPELSELIDCLPLVVTPSDTQSGYLYNAEDFKSWVDEYKGKIEHNNP